MNTMGIEDIAEKIETNKQLFADEENGSGVKYNEGVQSEEDEENKEGEMKKSYVGEQLDDGLKNAPTWKPGQKTGKRSEAFDFLLD
jgi:hypothetical protein